MLSEPLLYLSLYLKRHRQAYYDFLQRVRTHGDWEKWTDFFLGGVAETATQAADTAARLLQLFRVHRDRLHALGRKAGSALKLHDILQRQPVMTAPRLARDFGFTGPTANATFRVLIGEGIVREITGFQRNRVFAYDEYLRILNEGTELSATASR